MSHPGGRPAVRFSRAAELREATLVLTPALSELPLTVAWDEITPRLARGRILAIDDQPCDPPIGVVLVADEMPAATEVWRHEDHRAGQTTASMGPSPAGRHNHRETE